MKLSVSRMLRGCNAHYASTVIRQQVELGPLAGLKSDAADADFAERFLARFSELRERIPDSVMSESFLERLRSPAGAPFEEVLLEAILAVETAAAFAKHDLAPIGFAAIVPGKTAARVQLVWESHALGTSRAAAAAALAGCLELLPEELRSACDRPPEDFASALAALEARARRAERSTTTAVLALSARRRKLPCETLRGPYLRLGQGAAQRLIYSSMTDRTSVSACQLAANKQTTMRRLAELQLPVTQQILVATEDEAIRAADAIGYPVVIKPPKRKQAQGVTVGIRHAHDVPAAFARARIKPRRVIVESFVPGEVYRLLVIGGRFVAALKTVPPTVTGDGERTVRELVEALNRDPLRDGVRLFPVPIDGELARDVELVGGGLDQVLEAGRTIAVRSAANAAIGGIHSDVTENVHPDNQEVAIRAAEGIGLDVAGIDFITEDVARSHKEIGGRIIEVNARPGFCMHTFPAQGKGRDAAGAFLELVFPPGQTGRIPTAVIAGGRGKGRIARDLDLMLRASGKTVGIATRKSTLIDGTPSRTGTVPPGRALPILLRDRRVQALVTTVALRRAKRGLGLESCDVAAILRSVDDDASVNERKSVDVIARATAGMLAVSARDRGTLQALCGFDAKRLILIGSNARDPVIATHVAADGPVVLRVRERHQDWIVLYRGGKVLVSIRVGAPGQKRLGARRLETRMFAVALAFGLGLSAADIEAGLQRRRAALEPYPMVVGA